MKPNIGGRSATVLPDIFKNRQKIRQSGVFTKFLSLYKKVNMVTPSVLTEKRRTTAYAWVPAPLDSLKRRNGCKVVM